MISERMSQAAVEFADACNSPARAQSALLERILRRASDTKYGKQLGFSKISSLEEFRRSIPMAHYGDIADLVARSRRGEADLLVPGVPVFFARTSGTSGNPKEIPFSIDTPQEYVRFLGPALVALDQDHPGAYDHGFSFSGKYLEDRSEANIPIGGASGFVRKELTDVPFYCSVPERVFEETNYDVRYYSILRLILAQEIRSLGTLNPSSVLTLFKKAEQFREGLLRDLRDGAMRSGPAGTEQVEPSLAAVIRPEPEAALRLDRMFSQEGQFVPQIAWPHLRVIELWKGGSTKYYLDLLREKCPGCALRPTVSGSSEAALLVPLHDDWTGGVPALLSTVFDFFPADEPEDSATAVNIEDLVPNQGYRVAVTNSRGLYRYAMDDVFFVEGQYRNTPVLTFSHRLGLVSSLTGEKLTEAQIVQAFSDAGAVELSITDYQVGPEWGDPPRYLVLVEIDGSCPPNHILRAFLARFEHRLCELNGEYLSKRNSFRLSAPRLAVTEEGFFDRLRSSFAEASGRSDAQLKLPRIRRELIDETYVDTIRSVELSAEG